MARIKDPQMTTIFHFPVFLFPFSFFRSVYGQLGSMNECGSAFPGGPFCPERMSSCMGDSHGLDGCTVSYGPIDCSTRYSTIDYMDGMHGGGRTDRWPQRKISPNRSRSCCSARRAHAHPARLYPAAIHSSSNYCHVTTTFSHYL